MFKITGKYNSANIFIDQIDAVTRSQIQNMMNHPAFANSYIAVMPDTHAGKGSVIGFTMKLNDYIIPNIVGVDIGCGIEAVCLGSNEIDFKALDSFIDENVPSGFKGHETPAFNFPQVFSEKDYWTLQKLLTKINYSPVRAENSLGSLGGGNHFIEIDKDPDGNYWLVIHSGSRGFGLNVATYHQKKAKELMKKMFIGADAYRDLEFLPVEEGGSDYLNDMYIVQKYALKNREIMFRIILENFFRLNLDHLEKVSSVHNYINPDDTIIRKGAIQANEGQRCIIPFNMRDGVAICTGKGNKKYNYSAPHGAGRILSRSQAKKDIKLEDFQEAMQGIYSSSITEKTLDESPMAYKDMQVILDNIHETVDVNFLMKPVYNFKAK